MRDKGDTRFGPERQDGFRTALAVGEREARVEPRLAVREPEGRVEPSTYSTFTVTAFETSRPGASGAPDTCTPKSASLYASPTS